jgi:LacI family transcriptional regulator
MDSGQEADGEVAALRTLLAHRVDGLLVSTIGIDRERFDALVTRRGAPCVFFDSGVEGVGDGTVLLDNTVGIELLVEHLVAHGHRRIGFVTGSLRETSGLDRLRTFHAAMRRHGLATPAERVAGGRWTLENGRDSTRRILAAAEPPTALIASSVELALGALQACRELGVAIPGALALATFDDAYFAELLDPPLTAVAYDPSDVGAQAASLLVEAIRDAGSRPRRVTIPVTLVTRRSCGCTY